MTNSLLAQYQSLTQADVAHAVSLPFAVYHNADVFELEMNRVFHDEWLFVCAQSQVNEVGDYFALSLAGESVALIRGKDNQLRLLSNNCRHRGTPLLDNGFGNLSKNIVCPYHAWTYDDQGQFKGAPFTGEVNIDKQAHCLARFSVACWQGLVFVHLGDKPKSLDQRLTGLDSVLGIYQNESMQHFHQGESQRWHCNWKLAVENAIESYHLFKVHGQTLELYTPTKQSFYVTGGSRYTVTGGRYKSTSNKLMKWLSGGYPEAYDHYLLVFLPPEFIGIIAYGSFNWINILPDGPEHCRIDSGGLFAKTGQSDRHEQQFTQAFMDEDKLICERVQQGMTSRFGRGGKLVSMEQPLVDFRHFLAQKLFDFKTPAHQTTEQAKMFK